MARPVSSTVTLPRMIGLFVFVATAAVFLGALAHAVPAGLHDVQQFAAAFSYLVGALALAVMFFDVYDLWVRGRRLSGSAARSIRMVVLVAILASMAATLLGRNTTLVIFFMPSVLIYYVTMRPQPATGRPAAPGGRGVRAGGSGRGGTGGKSRQRKGGRKRR